MEGGEESNGKEGHASTSKNEQVSSISTILSSILQMAGE